PIDADAVEAQLLAAGRALSAVAGRRDQDPYPPAPAPPAACGAMACPLVRRRLRHVASRWPALSCAAAGERRHVWSLIAIGVRLVVRTQLDARRHVDATVTECAVDEKGNVVLEAPVFLVALVLCEGLTVQ